MNCDLCNREQKGGVWALRGYYGLTGRLCGRCYGRVSHDAYGRPKHPAMYRNALQSLGAK